MIEIIKYDTEKYNFRKYFEDCLGKLEDIHLNHRIEDIGESTAGGVVFDKSRDSTYYGLIERLFREVVHGPYTFRYMWWEFQKEVIKPWFLGDAVLHDGAIVIQKLPSIKIFPSKTDWLFVEETTMVNGRETNRHYETDYPFYHPEFETNIIMPLIDCDEDNGIFLDDIMHTPKHGEIVFFDQVSHGGYVHNESKNTRVSMDFKACGWGDYDNESLSDTLKVKKRGEWHIQKDLFKIGNYYNIL